MGDKAHMLEVRKNPNSEPSTSLDSTTSIKPGVISAPHMTCWLGWGSATNDHLLDALVRCFLWCFSRNPTDYMEDACALISVCYGLWNQVLQRLPFLELDSCSSSLDGVSTDDFGASPLYNNSVTLISSQWFHMSGNKFLLKPPDIFAWVECPEVRQYRPRLEHGCLVVAASWFYHAGECFLFPKQKLRAWELCLWTKTCPGLTRQALDWQSCVLLSCFMCLQMAHCPDSVLLWMGLNSNWR